MRSYFLLLVFLKFAVGAVAQVNANLPMVEILGATWRSETVGSNAQTIDSTALQSYQSSSIADVLVNESQIFIKSYGQGSLATTTTRGGSAGHTAFLWNGFTLQNPMLGLLDIALLPAGLFDEVQVQQGGNSALWGSGAIGGVVQLNNHALQQEGFRLAWNGTFGSFGLLSDVFKIHYGRKNYKTSLRLFHKNVRNDFPFQLGKKAEQRQAHARNLQYGLLNEHQFQYQAHIFNLRIWLQRADREIPPTTVQRRSAATQVDENIRLTLNWKKIGERAIWQARTGVFRDFIHYQDSLSSVDSESYALSSISEVESRWALPKGQIHLGLNNTYIRAYNDGGYPNGKGRNEAALFAAYGYQFKRWQIRASIRQGLTNSSWNPIVPALEAQSQLKDWLLLKAKVSRNYRLPTFNDLFWGSVGDPNLRPELGFGQELTIVAQHKKANYQLTAFNRNVEDWILWQPLEGAWRPVNVANVWSRGFEQRLKWNMAIKEIQLGLHGGHDFVLSTNQSGDYIGKQLIYVPKHKSFAQLSIGWRQWNFRYRQQFTSSVYIRAGNSERLEGYSLGTSELRYAWKYAKLNGQFRFQVHNAWDVPYRVIERRVMPGQHFEFGISLW